MPGYGTFNLAMILASAFILLNFCSKPVGLMIEQCLSPATIEAEDPEEEEFALVVYEAQSASKNSGEASLLNPC